MEWKIIDFGRWTCALTCVVGGSARPGLNPSLGRIFEEEESTSSRVLNTPMTHQGGLAELKRLRPFRRPLKVRKNIGFQEPRRKNIGFLEPQRKNIGFREPRRASSFSSSPPSRSPPPGPSPPGEGSP